jgi:hypothetical protein
MAYEEEYKGIICWDFLVFEKHRHEELSLIPLLEKHYGVRIDNKGKFANEVMALFETMHAKGLIEPA